MKDGENKIIASTQDSSATSISVQDIKNAIKLLKDSASEERECKSMDEKDYAIRRRIGMEGNEDKAIEESDKIIYRASKLSDSDIISEGKYSPFDELLINIIKAKKEALKRDIKVNAIALSDDLYYSFAQMDSECVPVILGMKVFRLDGCFPEGTSFAVFHGYKLPPSKEEKLVKLEAEIGRFKKAISDIQQIADDCLQDCLRKEQK